jgi:hypothetical protein
VVVVAVESEAQKIAGFFGGGGGVATAAAGFSAAAAGVLWRQWSFRRRRQVFCDGGDRYSAAAAGF